MPYLEDSNIVGTSGRIVIRMGEDLPNDICLLGWFRCVNQVHLADVHSEKASIPPNYHISYNFSWINIIPMKRKRCFTQQRSWPR